MDGLRQVQRVMDAARQVFGQQNARQILMLLQGRQSVVRGTQQRQQAHRVAKCSQLNTLLRIMLEQQNFGFQMGGFIHGKALAKWKYAARPMVHARSRPAAEGAVL